MRHPVVRLSFGKGHFKAPEYLHTNLMAQLDGVERGSGVTSTYATGPERFGHLVEALHERTGRRVAVLVDEYDKPILDALDVPDVARANRDYLRGLYAVIKDSDAHIRFGERVFACRLPRRTARPDQLDHLAPVLPRIRWMSLCRCEHLLCRPLSIVGARCEGH